MKQREGNPGTVGCDYEEMMAVIDTLELVAASRAGDKEAFSQLLRQNREMPLKVATRLVGADVAQDAFQEAALKAWLSLDRLAKPESFGAWLTGIAINVCKTWLRAPQAELSWEVLSGGALLTNVRSLGPTPEELSEEEETRRAITEAVRRLPRGQREAVTRFYIDGMTHQEIANVLGVSPGAVKTRLHKARENLRNELTKEEPMSDVTTMELIDVVLSHTSNGMAMYIALLADEKDTLPIWMGQSEGTSLAMQLETIETPRPMTYALAANLVSAVGGRVKEVRIEKLEEGTFYATVVAEGSNGEVAIDSRPSDALNLALVMGAPIRVHRDVVVAARDTKHTLLPEVIEKARRGERDSARIIRDLRAPSSTKKSEA